MVRFVVGKGRNAARFDRADRHTPQWDRQKAGFSSRMGLVR